MNSHLKNAITNRLDVTHYFASYFATLKCNIDSGLALDIFELAKPASIHVGLPNLHTSSVS